MPGIRRQTGVEGENFGKENGGHLGCRVHWAAQNTPSERKP